MLEAGSTVLIPSGPAHDPDRKHLFVVMTPPSGPARQVLIVPIVTEHEKSDLTCRLDSGDHPFLRRPSVVEYRRARIEFAARIEACVASGEFVQMETLGAVLLARIRAGFHTSRYAKPFARSFLDEHVP